MKLENKIAIVTGAARGIGRAIAERFAREGCAGVVIADANEQSANDVAKSIGGLAFPLDVARLDDHHRLVEEVLRRFGKIDVFVANAGILTLGGVDLPSADWDRAWAVNVMAHVHAARAALPHLINSGMGAFVSVASAAGLLSQIDAAPYAVTKHAAVAFAEWLSITYGDQGLYVGCVCPLGVRTDMLFSSDRPAAKHLVEGAISPEDVADAVVAGMAAERFLILPHPIVGEYVHRKASDRDRWLRGMRRLQASFREAEGDDK